MKRVMAVLVLLGALAIVLAVMGISSYSTTTHGTVITHFHSMLPRVAGGAYGACLLLLAYGIYRRSIMAYRGGWGVLAACYVWFLYISIPVVLASQPRPSAWVLAVFVAAVVVGISLVFTIWGKWWHRQLDYFQRNAG